MRNKHVLVAVILTYLLVSFVPSIALTNLLGKRKGKLCLTHSVSGSSSWGTRRSCWSWSARTLRVRVSFPRSAAR